MPGQVWDNDELSCEAAGWGGGMIFLFIVLGFLGAGIFCCACYYIVFKCC